MRRVPAHKTGPPLYQRPARFGTLARLAPPTLKTLRKIGIIAAKASLGNKHRNFGRHPAQVPIARSYQHMRQSGLKREAGNRLAIDRKSVVWGKSVSVRVDFGGRRIIKKKKTKIHTTNNYET